MWKQQRNIFEDRLATPLSGVSRSHGTRDSC